MLIWLAAMVIALHLIADAVASAIGRRAGEAIAYVVFAAIAALLAVNIEKIKLFVAE